MADELVRESLSRSVEDYLKTIYRICEDGRPASTSQIAEALSLAPPSVSGMVKRLSELGLLSHEPYRGVTLTESGVRLTRKGRRKGVEVGWQAILSGEVALDDQLVRSLPLPRASRP